MPTISIYVSDEQKQKKKELDLKWSNILSLGFKVNENAEKVFALTAELKETIRELEELKADYKIRGKKLQKYIETYGLNEDIMFKFKSEE
jgi:hypothetical protein